MVVTIAAGVATLVLGACGSGDEELGIEVRSARTTIDVTTTTVTRTQGGSVAPHSAPVESEPPAGSVPALDTTRSPGRVSGVLHVSTGESLAHVVIEHEDGSFVARHESASTGPFVFEGLDPGTYRLRNGAESEPVIDEAGAAISSQWSARSDLFTLDHGQDAYFVCGLDRQVCTPG